MYSIVAQIQPSSDWIQRRIRSDSYTPPPPPQRYIFFSFLLQISAFPTLGTIKIWCVLFNLGHTNTFVQYPGNKTEETDQIRNNLSHCQEPNSKIQVYVSHPELERKILINQCDKTQFKKSVNGL